MSTTATPTSPMCGACARRSAPTIEIMIDVNMGWSADTAIQMGRKFQDYDVYWLEEPVPAEDFAGYLRIAEALDLRIVGGETHFTRYDLRPFLENPKLPILQPDVMRGGLTELRKIAALADTWGMSLAPHLFPELMVQVMAAIPNGIWLEQMGWLDDLWVEKVPVVADGHGARAAGPRAGVQAGGDAGSSGPVGARRTRPTLTSPARGEGISFCSMCCCCGTRLPPPPLRGRVGVGGEARNRDDAHYGRAAMPCFFR